jgi:hypothetical protein
MGPLHFALQLEIQRFVPGIDGFVCLGRHRLDEEPLTDLGILLELQGHSDPCPERLLILATLFEGQMKQRLNGFWRHARLSRGLRSRAVPIR